MQLNLCSAFASKRFIISSKCIPDKLPDANVYSLAAMVYRDEHRCERNLSGYENKQTLIVCDTISLIDSVVDHVLVFFR